MSKPSEEAQKIVGGAYLQGAREAGKEDAKATKDKPLDPKTQKVKDLIDAAVATPGVQVLITVYRRGSGTLRTEEQWIGVIDYITPVDLKMYPIEAILEDFAGGGKYRYVIRVPQLSDFEDVEAYASVNGRPLPPKHKREQAAMMGISVEQLIAQESGQAYQANRFGPVGPGTPQMGGLPTQQMGMQPGYGMQQPYGNPQVHMGAPYGGYPQFGQQQMQPWQHPAFPGQQGYFAGQQQQSQQSSSQDKLIEKLADRALNPPAVQKDDDGDNKLFEAFMKRMEDQDRRWEESERRRQEAEDRREERRRDREERQREREESERKWREREMQHEKETREAEMRYEKERDEQRRREDERRWQEQMEAIKGGNNKNPTMEMIEVLVPLANAWITAAGSKESAQVELMRLMMGKPTDEDRIAKIYEIMGNSQATQVGLVGTILNNLLNEKAGEEHKWWVNPLMNIIDQAGEVGRVALGGMMDDMEEEEEEEAGEVRRLPPPGARQRGLQPPPGMQPGPQQPQQQQQQPPDAATAAAQARQRIAAAHAQMERMRQAQMTTQQEVQEGQVIDIPNEQQPSVQSIQKFDSAMQTIFGMVSGDGDPHEIAFLVWKHAASGVRSAIEWLNHGVEASYYLLGGLRANDEITVSDERIAQVGGAIQDFYTYLQQNGSPEAYAEQHKIQRSMPKSTRLDPVRGRTVQTQHRTTASLDGQGQASFGEGRADEVQQTGGEFKGREMGEAPQQEDQQLPDDQNPFAKKPTSQHTAEPDPDAIAKQVEAMTAKAKAARPSQSTEPAPTANPALAKKPPAAKMAPNPGADAGQSKPKMVSPPKSKPVPPEEPPAQSGP